MFEARPYSQWLGACSAMTPMVALVCFSCIALFGILIIKHAKLHRTFSFPRQKNIWRTEKQSSIDNKDGSTITPLHALDLMATPPLPLRPFMSKPVYHLTMGVQSCAQEDLYVLDNQYLARIREREQTMEAHGEDVTRTTTHPGVRVAVNELYETLLRDHLPRRFPTVFQCCDAEGVHVDDATLATHLKIVPDNGRLVSLSPSADPVETLRTLGRVSDDDHIILFPSPCKPFDDSPPEADEVNATYTAHAYVFCCPAGFEPSKAVLGNPLAVIHGPVPGFAQKLQRSVDRSFARLQYGSPIRRVNWTVVPDSVAYKPDGNHMYHEPDSPEELEGLKLQVEQTDPSSSFLRVERQTLQRLRDTGAIVFSLKTYLTPLSVIRTEGSGDELATAIEGLQKGNVPGMWLYKRGPVWGERVCAYLRGGGGGGGD